jgi:tetratricopeptide (TPR) repeat protein
MKHAVLVLSIVLAGCAQPQRAPGPPAADFRGDPAEHIRAGHQAFGAQDFARAAAEYAAAVNAGADSPLVHFRYGYALHVTGYPEQALPHHLKAVEIENPALRIDALYNAACACALLGRREQALSWLSKAIDAGFRDLEQVRTDPDMDSLRADAEFKRLVESMSKPASSNPPGL